MGWHPHVGLAGGDLVRRQWLAAAELREIHSDIREAGVTLRSVRMGGAWHSNATMQLLDELGYWVDSSAIPGRTRSDEVIQFDWGPTPNYPYHPSSKDYRVTDASESLGLIEVPITTIEICAPYDDAPLRRYINPTYKLDIFGKAVAAYLQTVRTGEAVLVVIFHPGELLSAAPSGLYSHDWEVFERNLDAVLLCLEGSGVPYFFKTMGEAVR